MNLSVLIFGLGREERSSWTRVFWESASSAVCGVCAWVGGGDAKNEQLLRECQLASFDMNTSSKHSKFATVTALL